MTSQTDFLVLREAPTAVNHAVSKEYSDAQFTEAKSYTDLAKSASQLDTIKELADFLKADGTVADGLSAQMGAVAASIASESSRAGLAEVALGGRVTDEVTRALSAESLLLGRITAETSRATAAEAAVQFNLNTDRQALYDRVNLDRAAADAVSLRVENAELAATNLSSTTEQLGFSVEGLESSKFAVEGGEFTGAVQMLDYVYIGNHWRIAASGSGDRLQFEWSTGGKSASDSVGWSIGVPFISAVPN